jgi:hypothetical protein
MAATTCDHVSMTVRMAVAVKRTFITMAAAAIGSRALRKPVVTGTSVSIQTDMY